MGRPFYIGDLALKVATVTSADALTVQTLGGGAYSFASNFTETYHYTSTSGSGTCSVSGATVTRLTGDPFIPFISSPFVLKINGTERAVLAFGSIDQYTLSSSPGDVTNVPFTYETVINDQLATFRLQKMVGADEENLSLYARHDGYWMHSLYAGSGQYRRLIIGSGESTPGTLARQLVVQKNGDLSLCGDYDYEAIRILNQTGAVNRLETQAALTGVAPAWRARGSDTNVGFGFDTKGSGNFNFSGNSFGNTLLQVFGSTTGTSWLGVATSTTDGPILSANGSASNIDIRLSPKGTGRVWIGAWESNADASVNGYFYVKDDTGTLRKAATIE